MKRIWFIQIALFVCLPAGVALAADPDPALTSCASCHSLSASAKAGVDRLWERGGPDLHYAGVKFNKDWLVAWLQNPTRIRPAGELYTKHIKKGTDSDEIDSPTLQEHPKLSEAQAQAAANALMALTGPPDLVTKGAYKNQKVAKATGSMFFNKLRGCSACHQTAPDTGGRSGPELYTASQRLQMDYVVDYIRNPQKFDPNVWMPKLALAEEDIQRLSAYLALISAPQEKK